MSKEECRKVTTFVLQELRKQSTQLTVADCGAGIGRISKCLLAGLFDRIDMVEPCAKFLAKVSSV